MSSGMDVPWILDSVSGSTPGSIQEICWHDSWCVYMSVAAWMWLYVDRLCFQFIKDFGLHVHISEPERPEFGNSTDFGNSMDNGLVQFARKQKKAHKILVKIIQICMLSQLSRKFPETKLLWAAWTEPSRLTPRSCTAAQRWSCIRFKTREPHQMSCTASCGLTAFTARACTPAFVDQFSKGPLLEKKNSDSKIFAERQKRASLEGFLLQLQQRRQSERDLKYGANTILVTVELKDAVNINWH